MRRRKNLPDKRVRMDLVSRQLYPLLENVELKMVLWMSFTLDLLVVL